MKKEIENCNNNNNSNSNSNESDSFSKSDCSTSTSTIKYKNSLLEFDSTNHSKLTKLILNNTVIIDSDLDSDGNTNTNYLASGSYIMYPWNGRIDNDNNIKKCDNNFNNINNINNLSHFKDNNGLPIHGLYCNTKRNISNENENTVILTPTEINRSFPSFYEKFELNEKSLIISTYFENITDSVQYFSYGYHPHIRLSDSNSSNGSNGNSINNMIIKSNINRIIKTSDKLVPVINDSDSDIIKESINLNGKLDEKFFDTLFKYEGNEEPYILLSDDKLGKSVLVKSIYESNDDYKNIKLNYYQLYTPPKRNCIAIEPMCSPTNSFNINFPNNMIILNPGEKAYGKFIISLTP